MPVTPIPTTPTNNPPTVTVEPTLNPFPSPTLVTTGPTEVVFNWKQDQCEKFDIPDLPAHAIRTADGNVSLFSTHLVGRRFVGPNLNEVIHECASIMESDHDADSSLFNDNEWIASPYTEDGQTIYAIIHNEFHGFEHGLTCPGDNFSCWYNAITLGVSTDGGESFHDGATPPNHLIATLPHPYEAGAGPYGVFEPSNIIKKDGYYYVFIRIDEYKSDEQRICLMRTNDLSDPKSWRAWDGTDFTIQFLDPYTLTDSSDAKDCTGLEGDLGLLGSSITYNTYLNRYVMVGISTDNFSSDREIWGVMYAFSNDLIHWDRRTLLFEAPLPWSRTPDAQTLYLYPSLIDSESDSRNFETSGKTAYIYLTRFNGGDPLDRDLVRIPVEFFPTKTEAQEAEVPFIP